MWGLIADAVGGISPEAVGTIVGAALGSTGTWCVVRARRVTGMAGHEEAQRVFLEDKFATREEVADIKRQHREEVADMHARLTGITVKLNEMYGQQNMMIEILKSRKSL